MVNKSFCPKQKLNLKYHRMVNIMCLTFRAPGCSGVGVEPAFLKAGGSGQGMTRGGELEVSGTCCKCFSFLGIGIIQIFPSQEFIYNNG